MSVMSGSSPLTFKDFNDYIICYEHNKLYNLLLMFVVQRKKKGDFLLSLLSFDNKIGL